jgi:hypothetical protein
MIQNNSQKSARSIIHDFPEPPSVLASIFFHFESDNDMHIQVQIYIITRTTCGSPDEILRNISQ